MGFLFAWFLTQHIIKFICKNNKRLKNGKKFSFLRSIRLLVTGIIHINGHIPEVSVTSILFDVSHGYQDIISKNQYKRIVTKTALFYLNFKSNPQK